MSNNNTNKKYKKPKQKTQSTTNPTHSKQGCNVLEKNKAEPLCPLAAKDSEWVDILQSSASESVNRSSTNVSDEEEVLQLVECEDGPQMKPLAIMFPGLLEKDPSTLQGMLNKAMSTTEVTKHLVDLGQKANFTFMKKADRLIPPEKIWLESLTENSNSFSSTASALLSSLSSNYEADNGIIASNLSDTNITKIKKERRDKNTINIETTHISTGDIFANIQQIVMEVVQNSTPGNDEPNDKKGTH